MEERIVFGVSLILLAVCNGHFLTDTFATTCGYKSCNPVKDGMINVHLVPHTHDDVGWLKTVDQYYYGGKNYIQFAQVKYVLDSVVEELLKDPKKRFIYVEIAFFERWWQEQFDFKRHQVKQLVQEGRLEFILGGWCMNDEATTHYNAIIDQHTLGFEFLRENFGECGRPRVAWQIDPFGHSREQASLFAQMGFDGLFFGRLDYQDKDVRMKEKRMEMIWKGSPGNLGDRANLFTGVLFNGYNPPGGFCWDAYCADEPIQDDPRLHDYNVESRVSDFLAAVQDQAKSYATNHLIMTMGSDFQYSNAPMWYNNLDKLINYVNAKQSNGSKVNLLYSTPSCYLYQLNLANKTWTTKEDDFFPYAHRAHSFWTGYFTSRATLKDYVRRTNNFLQVSKQMDALAQLEDTDNSTYNLQILMKAMGVLQHHDAVSGTEKQPVAYDYATRLAEGVAECEKVINDAYKKLLPKTSTPPPGMSFCPLLNISMCSTTAKNKQFQVHIYNPLGHALSHYVDIPVAGKKYAVVGPDGKSVPNEVIPVPLDTFRIPERKGALAKYKLVFLAKLPPLGFATYFVQITGGKSKESKFIKPRKLKKGANVILSNDLISLTFDGTTGKMKTMKNMQKNISVKLTQDFAYYPSMAGNNSKGIFQASGAYIFRPNSSHADQFKLSRPMVRHSIVQGQLVQEVSQVFSPWVTQNVRVYQGQPYAELEWTVGPIPIKDKIGKEVISLFSTDLKTNGTYYTDANGREILQRVRDYRPTWPLNQTEPVSGNYYPINSRIYVQDTSRNIQFTVLTDRSEGGGSITGGSIEIMVHRRTLYDDALGVGEPLNETGSDGQGLIVRGRHYLLLDTIADSPALHRELALKLYMSPSLSFTTDTRNYQTWSQNFRTIWSGLKKALPDNVHLLTLEQFPSLGPVPTRLQPFLIRLEHFYEKGEDPNLSKPVTLDLRNIFAPFTITSAAELTLGANLPLRELERLQWRSTDSQSKESTLFFQPSPVGDPFTITLHAMEIRTFQVEVKNL